jgi:hypothetical protein
MFIDESTLYWQIPGHNEQVRRTVEDPLTGETRPAFVLAAPYGDARRSAFRGTRDDTLVERIAPYSTLIDGASGGAVLSAGIAVGAAVLTQVLTSMGVDTTPIRNGTLIAYTGGIVGSIGGISLSWYFLARQREATDERVNGY